MQESKPLLLCQTEPLIIRLLLPVCKAIQNQLKRLISQAWSVSTRLKISLNHMESSTELAQNIVSTQGHEGVSWKIYVIAETGWNKKWIGKANGWTDKHQGSDSYMWARRDKKIYWIIIMCSVWQCRIIKYTKPILLKKRIC